MRSRLAVVAVVVGLVVALGATAGSGSVAAKKFTGDPILIGSTAPEDISTATTLEEIRPSILAAVKTINAKGGVKTSDGKTHELKLVFCNNKADPNETERCANQMLDENVVAMVSSFDANAKVLYPILFQDGLASFAPVPASGYEFASSVSYPIQPGTVAIFAGMANAAIKAGVKTVRPLGIQGSEAQNTPIFNMLEPILEAGGGKLLDPIWIPGTTTDFAPAIAQALDGDPEGIFPMMNEEFATKVANALTQAPSKPTWLSVYGITTPDSVTQTGGAKGPLEGAILTANETPPTAKAWAAFRKSMKKYAPNTQLEPAGQNAWIATILLAEDIIPAIDGEVTRESLKAQLDATSDLDTRGTTATPIDFTTPFACGVLARVFNTYYWGPQVVKKGKITDAKGAAWTDGADEVIAGFGKLCDIPPTAAAPGAA